MKEPTLGNLENQEPTAEEDLKEQIGSIGKDLINVRLFLRWLRSEERALMEDRAKLRLLVDHLKVERITAPTLPVTGTVEPICPDCTLGDN